LVAVKKARQKIDAKSVQLLVVDLDKNKRYPLNFVCVLPRYLRLLEKRRNTLQKFLGTKRLYSKEAFD
jgi:hypothetical protein